MKKVFTIFSLLLLTVLLLLTISITGVQAASPTFKSPLRNNRSSPTGKAPYVQGAQIMDGNGQPLILRGAQMESPFIYIAAWQQGKRPTSMLTSASFQAMVNWHMNTLRLPISNWIYATAPTEYMSQLDQIVQEANAAGLYVILDLHDNAQSGSPYGSAANLPKKESLAFWKMIATRYKNNAMLMYDIYNEPMGIDWQTWQHGGITLHGATIVGVQDVVNGIRSVGAKQIIIVEPGGPSANRKGPGWSSIGKHVISAPNIVYSLHVYQGITETPQQLDARWGAILNHYPIIYGEWALLTNGYGEAGYDHCKDIVHAQADQDVNNFLQYLTSRHANWIAWEFRPHYLIQDATTFTPTTLDIPWTCGDVTSYAGMGSLIKQYLLHHA